MSNEMIQLKSILETHRIGMSPESFAGSLDPMICDYNCLLCQIGCALCAVCAGLSF